MNGRKSILCSARDSYRIRLSKIIKGNCTDPLGKFSNGEVDI